MILYRIIAISLLIASLLGAGCARPQKARAFRFPAIIDDLPRATSSFNTTYHVRPYGERVILDSSTGILDLATAEGLLKSSIDESLYLRWLEEEIEPFPQAKDIRANLEIHIDTACELSLVPWELIHSTTYQNDTSDRTNYHVKSLPVYLVNRSDSVVILPALAGSMIVTQEAVDFTGCWRPIESWEFGSCSFSDYLNINYLKPYHYAMTKVYKYDGSFETDLRVRIALFYTFDLTRQYEGTIYSPAFRGRINPEQFQQERTL